MKLFNSIDGNPHNATGDDKINLRFRCSKKQRGEPPDGELAILLEGLRLDMNSTIPEIKEAIWNSLNITKKPLHLLNSERSILDRAFNNAADVPILRENEGGILLEKLGLPSSSSKRNLEYAILDYVCNKDERPVYKKNDQAVNQDLYEWANKLISGIEYQELINDISALRKDLNHQERAHESLVENFLLVLGYKRIQEIKYRQGRIDISIHKNGNISHIFEVKRDWKLTIDTPRVTDQAYSYANKNGGRFVIITNGDYYGIFDRHIGDTYHKNYIGEFYLSSLKASDANALSALKRQ